MLRRFYCWFRHQWEQKTIVRRKDVRYVQRCRRCGELAVRRDDPDRPALRSKRKTS